MTTCSNVLDVPRMPGPSSRTIHSVHRMPMCDAIRKAGNGTVTLRHGYCIIMGLIVWLFYLISSNKRKIGRRFDYTHRIFECDARWWLLVGWLLACLLLVKHFDFSCFFFLFFLLLIRLVLVVRLSITNAGKWFAWTVPFGKHGGDDQVADGVFAWWMCALCVLIHWMIFKYKIQPIRLQFTHCHHRHCHRWSSKTQLCWTRKISDEMIICLSFQYAK